MTEFNHKQKLAVGYVGLALSTYFSEEYSVQEKSVSQLKKLAEVYDFELKAVTQPILSIEDAEKAAAFIKSQKVDFLLVQNSSCSMGEQFVPLVEAAPRLGLWAAPEPTKEGEIKLNSFVSMTMNAGYIRRWLKQEVPFKWFIGAADSKEFIARFRVTVRALTALKNLNRAKIGIIGGLAPGFYNMVCNERDLYNRLGVVVNTHGLDDIVKIADAFQESEVQSKSEAIANVATAVTVSNPRHFLKATRLQMALKKIAEDNGYAAMGMQCWSKIQEIYEIAPCMAFSWMGSDENFPVSCEGDISGAVSMYLLNLLTASNQSSALLDFTSFDAENDTLLAWHCGVAPRHFANDEGIKWVDHTTLGRKGEQSYGVSGDQVFAPAKTTIAYVGNDASRLLVLDADIVEGKNKGFAGTRGWFANFHLNKEKIEVMDLLNTLVSLGHEHHFAICHGDVSSELMEFSVWADLDLVKPIPYTDYIRKFEM